MFCFGQLIPENFAALKIVKSTKPEPGCTIKISKQRRFPAKASSALIFFGSFLASRQKRNWGLGQRPTEAAFGFQNCLIIS